MIEFDTPCTPGDEEWHRRLAAFMADDGPVVWWWLSFVDTSLPYREEDDYPGGPRFMGVCIVPAPNIVFAGQVAWALGCNPGGQVGGYAFTIKEGWRLKDEYVGKFFPREEAMALAELDPRELVEEG